MIRIRCVLLALVLVSSVAAISGLVGLCIHDTSSVVRPLQASYTVNINVTVVDDFGRNISGATIFVRGNATAFGPTNDSGYWEITGLADDVTEYRLYAVKANYLTDADYVQTVTGNETYNVTLRIIGGTILGTVTSQSGFIVGAYVEVADAVLNLSAYVSPIDGSYMISGIPAGTHTATASAPGYSPLPKAVTISAGGAAQLNFILVPRNGTIIGFVHHLVGSNLYPLGDATVSVNLTDRTTTVQTRLNGSYEIPDLPEGTYEVVASKEGYYPVAIAGVVVTKDNTTMNVNFTLEVKPSVLYGTVKSGALLLRQVNVSLVGTPLFNITSTSGDFRIENITAGTYNVSAAREGYVPALIQDVVLPIGGTIELDIDLTALPGAVLIGTVVDKSNPEKPLYNVVVTIFIGETEQRTELTDPLGHFGFTELAAGNYTVQFVATGYAPLEVRNIVLKENETTNVTFRMDPQREGFEGFIFGFDLAHSMMILALFITIVILAVAVYLRYRTFQTPETAPAVYDHEEDEAAEKTEEKTDAASDVDKKDEKEVL